MSVSDKVKAGLALCGKKNIELAQHFGMSAQSMQNKLGRESFSAKDLIKYADFVGARLALLFPDGQVIYFDPEAEKENKY